MKTKLAVLLFLLTPVLQSSTEWYVEQGVILWETELIANIRANEIYAELFQFSTETHGYFCGKADTYKEILATLRSRPQGVVNIQP